MLSFLAKWRHRSHSLTTRFIALAVSLFAVLQVVQLLSFTESVRTLRPFNKTRVLTLPARF